MILHNFSLFIPSVDSIHSFTFPFDLSFFLSFFLSLYLCVYNYFSIISYSMKFICCHVSSCSFIFTNSTIFNSFRFAISPSLYIFLVSTFLPFLVSFFQLYLSISFLLFFNITTSLSFLLSFFILNLYRLLNVLAFLIKLPSHN